MTTRYTILAYGIPTWRRPAYEGPPDGLFLVDPNPLFTKEYGDKALAEIKEIIQNSPVGKFFNLGYAL